MSNCVFSSTNIPEGLNIDSITGLISGNLNKGVYNFTVTCQYGEYYICKYDIDLSINVVVKKYDVYLQDNIFGYKLSYK